MPTKYCCKSSIAFRNICLLSYPFVLCIYYIKLPVVSCVIHLPMAIALKSFIACFRKSSYAHSIAHWVPHSLSPDKDFLGLSQIKYLSENNLLKLVI